MISQGLLLWTAASAPLLFRKENPPLQPYIAAMLILLITTHKRVRYAYRQMETQRETERETHTHTQRQQTDTQ